MTRRRVEIQPLTPWCLTPPSLLQGYHDYQQLGGGMLNGGAVMSSSVDYHQMARHTPNQQQPSLDWGTDYHGNG